ncbi:MAG: carboxypeptidase regulatory-like domain-containing protein [Aquabacterium sp.]|nr:carboxypeptidase regulatory-like domain-containing protein [Aquabacterium sp.]
MSTFSTATSAAISLTLLSLATSAHAASFTGKVSTAEGKPVVGALVTVFNEAKDRKETVYTDAAGRYAIRSSFKGKLTVRARSHMWQDINQAVVSTDDKPQLLNFQMVPFANAQALSDSLTASAHLTQVKWQDPAVRTAFVSQCNYCHQIGNALTRVPKDVSAWETTIARMEGYGALLTSSASRSIAETLHKGLDGKPVQAMQKYTSSDELSRAKVIEWHVGDAMSFIHDTDVGDDGMLYGTDEGHDLIWTLDRQTGQINKYPLPDIDLPQGGLFAAMQLPLGVFTGKHGPHSMAQGKDGRIWITNALSSKLMSFDPKTKQFKVYSIDESALYLHTIRIDQEGTVWFTAAVSNKVGRFDPRTEKFTMIQLPHGGVMKGIIETVFPTVLKVNGALFPGKNVPVTTSPHKWTQGHLMFNLPYGIDVNPKDGSIWYAKLLANKIGRIDAKTLAVQEFDTPMGGPRRPRFDKNGVLWIPAFDDSGLMRFDPTTAKFENFKLPLLAANEYETPYALNIHPTTGEVWITSNMSDRVLRFNPTSKTFIAYPSPTRVTWLRDLVFTKEGHVCSSSSNLPAYGIEDGRDAFFCLDPTGGDKDRAALTAKP